MIPPPDEVDDSWSFGVPTSRLILKQRVGTKSSYFSPGQRFAHARGYGRPCVADSVSPASPAEACYLILGEIESHECAGPFLEPVSELDAPGYFDVIQEPMDLATVRQRLPSHFADAPESGHEQFAADVRSIWANCKQYNDEKSDLWKWAHRIGRFFEKCYAARVLKPAAKAAKEADKAAKRAALAASKAQPGHDGRAKAASGSARGGNAARGGHGAGSGRSGGADAAADRRAISALSVGFPVP